jgi:hypothetical protein
MIMRYETPSVANVGSAIDTILAANGAKDTPPSDNQVQNYFCNLTETDD